MHDFLFNLYVFSYFVLKASSIYTVVQCMVNKTIVVKELTNERKTITNVIKDKSGKSLTEEKDVIKRWTECCSELYNYEANGDPTVLNFTSIEEEESLPILRTEVEAATR